MSKSRKFEDVLDECLDRLLVKHETLEQCLQSFPQHSDTLKPLLETALATRKMSAIRPTPEFRDRARQQFKSALQETGRQKSHVSFNWRWQPGWATAVAIVLVLSLVGGGTVAAASGSMPDSPLYTVKRAAEQVQMTLSFSELGKAELHAKLADKRVTEIIYLAEADKPEKIARTTENMNTHLTEITALVSTPEMASFAVTAPLLGQATAVEEAPVTIQAIVPQETPTTLPAPAAKTSPTAPTIPIPPPQAAAVERALDAKPKEEPAANITPLQVEGEKVAKETPASRESEDKGKEASPKADQRAKLKATVESQATSNNARLREVLATAPESAKPVLLRALNQSETEYKKAIEALK